MKEVCRTHIQYWA